VRSCQPAATRAGCLDATLLQERFDLVEEPLELLLRNRGKVIRRRELPIPGIRLKRARMDPERHELLAITEDLDLLGFALLAGPPDRALARLGGWRR
jgi:hypothetical protein